MVSWLREAHYQAAIALAVALIGFGCAWDGPALWHLLFTITASTMSAGFVHSEVKLANPAAGEVGWIVLALMSAIAVSASAYLGFEGSQLLFGLFLGVCGASATDGAMLHSMPGVAGLWYLSFGCAGLLVFSVWRRLVLCTLAPLLGGFLLTSGTGLLVARILALRSGEHVGEGRGLGWLPDHGDAWIDAAAALVGETGASTVLVIQALFALASAVVVEFGGSSQEAVLCLLAGILLSTILVLVGHGCEMLGSLVCPSWFGRVSDWRWLLLGSTLWCLVTGLAALKQLGETARNRRSSFLARQFGTLRSSSSQNSADLEKFHAQVPE